VDYITRTANNCCLALRKGRLTLAFGH